MDTSDDAPNTEGPRKKRAMGLDEPQDTTLSPPPCPSAQGRSNPDPCTALPPPSKQMDNRFDIVRLIRKARLGNAAKADETDELRVNLDFVSLGMISESQPQSNAPENTANIAPKRPAGQKMSGDHCLKSWARLDLNLLRLPYALDHEIVSFYDWAKPQEIENIVR
ncbi:hypothetical protein PENARI_c129G05728 [Penicillium arizonense]|uniref:Uncharacterized protein n=1 Tax=Penicillium arizonense TaxID=1835702 RepID=A0A1F5L0E8_PENAI|nr:hypothetical protein PENARI_c129G05728 [Penicillium arizonense]OGE46718.1 hypothetical protein PENARI_c129G05728 [Penicillium arizonense]